MTCVPYSQVVFMTAGSTLHQIKGCLLAYKPFGQHCGRGGPLQATGLAEIQMFKFPKNQDHILRRRDGSVSPRDRRRRL